MGPALSASALRVIAIVACVPLSSASTGCSFLLVTGVPERHTELRELECTTVRVVPAIDLALSALLVGTGTNSMLSPGRSVETKAVGASLQFAAAAVAAMASAHGLSETRACADAKAELEARAGSDRRTVDVERGTPAVKRELLAL